MLKLSHLSTMSVEEFTRVVGPVFDHSPWIAERTWSTRPWTSLEQLHAELSGIIQSARQEEQLALIRAHPDLVGRAVLTTESRGEQAAAKLADLTPDEINAFEAFNATYRERFGFPFVICARLNKKEAILRAFPERLAHSREKEIATALTEIGKIAKLRLRDIVK
ncbi:MAG: 2-oxo-4-hydroxy-4-carboxy-5-ureidoimidazoline decarboxylase [Chthoniobacterales bacterium]